MTPRDLLAIESQYTDRLKLLDKLAHNIQAELSTLLANVHNVDRIYCRTKGVSGFVAKAATQTDSGEWKYQYPLEEIEDQVAGRILVFYRADIQLVLGALTGRLRSAERIHRQPASAKEFDYETTHMICVITSDLMPRGWERLKAPPQTFELQIRTLAQHAWSEPQHAFYKRQAGLSEESKRKLYWAAASAWGMDSIWEELRHDLQRLDREH